MSAVSHEPSAPVSTGCDLSTVAPESSGLRVIFWKKTLEVTELRWCPQIFLTSICIKFFNRKHKGLTSVEVWGRRCCLWPRGLPAPLNPISQWWTLLLLPPSREQQGSARRPLSHVPFASVLLSAFRRRGNALGEGQFVASEWCQG